MVVSPVPTILPDMVLLAVMVPSPMMKTSPVMVYSLVIPSNIILAHFLEYSQKLHKFKYYFLFHLFF